jgi:hypothetical protein
MGILGMRAWAQSDGASSNDPELAAFLTLVRNTEITHERWQQDAVLESLGLNGQDTCVLVQFKFSRLVPPNPLDTGDLIEIAERFRESAETAQSFGGNVTGYALITNRALTNPANELIRAAKNDQPHRRLRFNYQRGILRNLRVPARLGISVWEDELIRFAADYGCEEQEIEDGIDRLVGSVVRRSAEGRDRPVTEGDLIQAFTDFRETRRITADQVRMLSARDLMELWTQLDLRAEPVRRDLIDTLYKATEESALVVLDGSGGCGKTVVMLHWANERVASRSMPGSAFAALSTAKDLRQQWIPELISGWANLPPDHVRRLTENPDRSIDRLLRANPEVSTPILFLGLDGVDECGESPARQDIIKDLLRWFWQENQSARMEARRHRASLVVTLRDGAEITDDWLPRLSSGFAYRGPEPPIVTAGEFSFEELERAARQYLVEPLAVRIAKAARILSDGLKQGTWPSAESQLLGQDDPSMPPANLSVVEALRHPAMWGALMRVDPSDHARVLDGDVEATHLLARCFIEEWFCEKLRRRGFRLPLVDSVAILKAIAQRCRAADTANFSTDHWTEGACADGMLNDLQARLLQREALSAGVIDGKSRGRWHWNHQLVYEYLADSQSDTG